MESVDKDVSAFAEHYAEKYRFSRDGLLLSCGLASLLLLASVEIVAEAGFYTFLRIYVCGVALACAVRFHLVGREVSALILLCMAILFNPIFRVELDQRAWQPLDTASAALFSWFALQRYAHHLRRKWIPFVPAAIIASLTFIGLTTSFAGFRRQAYPGNDMAVDNLTAENLVVENTAGDPLTSAPKIADPFKVTGENQISKTLPSLSVPANSMAVENLTAENLIVENTSSDDVESDAIDEGQNSAE